MEGRWNYRAIIRDPRSDPTMGSGAGLAVPRDEQRFPVVKVGGKALGAVTLRVTAKGPAVHIGTLLALFEHRLGAGEYARLKRSGAASGFATLDTLAAAGLAPEYDAAGETLHLTAH